MILIIGVLESVILITLSLIHFNWAFVGTWGFDKALPTNENNKRVLNPRKIDSAIVGLGLLIFGVYYLIKIRLIPVDIPSRILNYLGWIVVIIFMIRAIGDFKYVGFFKRIKKTEFGKLDSNYFSPLCLCIALFALVLELTH